MSTDCERLAECLAVAARHARDQGESFPTRQQDPNTERYQWLRLAARLSQAASEARSTGTLQIGPEQ